MNGSQATLNVVAVDLGASSGRVMLSSFCDGRIELKEIHRFPNTPIVESGSVFWNAPYIFNNIIEGIKKAAKVATLSSVAVDAWGVDFGLLDGAGNMLGNPFHYRNFLGKDLDALYARVSKEELYAETGIAEQVYNTSCQLLRQKTSNKDFAAAAKLLFIPDLVNYFLTGEMRAEATILSTSQLAKPFGKGLSSEILDKIGISPSLFSPIVQPTEFIGYLKPELKARCSLDYDLPVFAAASHDTAAAALSVPDESAFISSGTWSLLGSVEKAPNLSLEAMESGYTNETGGDGQITFLKSISGLWLVQELKRDFSSKGKEFSYALIENAAGSSACLSLIDVNDDNFFLPGQMGAKIFDYCKTTGQQTPMTEGDYFNIVYRSLAKFYNEVFRGLERLTKSSFPFITVVGGGSSDKYLNSLTAKELGKPVRAGIPEAASLGTALCQFIAIGAVKDFCEGGRLIRESFPITEYAYQAT